MRIVRLVIRITADDWKYRDIPIGRSGLVHCARRPAKQGDAEKDEVGEVVRGVIRGSECECYPSARTLYQNCGVFQPPLARS